MLVLYVKDILIHDLMVNSLTSTSVLMHAGSTIFFLISHVQNHRVASLYLSSCVDSDMDMRGPYSDTKMMIGMQADARQNENYVRQATSFTDYISG